MVDGESADDQEDKPDESAPLADLADQIRRRDADAEAGIGVSGLGVTGDDQEEDLFEEPTYDEVDADALWDALEDDDAAGALGRGVQTGAGQDEHIVPKRAYCEDCEYFSEPPEVHCTHSGTTIVEYSDIDHIRVRNCPIVQQRKELGGRSEESIDPDEFVAPDAE